MKKSYSGFRFLNDDIEEGAAPPKPGRAPWKAGVRLYWLGVAFSPYVAGEQFTQADCSAFNNLPLVGMATKGAYGEDLLLAGGVDYKPYIKLVSERPAAQKVAADRKAAQAKA